MIWCEKYGMYLSSPSEKTCWNCEVLEECYEYNKILQEAIKEGRVILNPL